MSGAHHNPSSPAARGVSSPHTQSRDVREETKADNDEKTADNEKPKRDRKVLLDICRQQKARESIKKAPIRGCESGMRLLRDSPGIRRLVRHSGDKCGSGVVYEKTCVKLQVFLENLIRDTVTYTEHARRKTITAMDIVYALKRQNGTLYGFGG